MPRKRAAPAEAEPRIDGCKSLLPAAAKQQRNDEKGSHCGQRLLMRSRGAALKRKSHCSAKGCMNPCASKAQRLQAREEALLAAIHRRLKDLGRSDRRAVIEGCFTQSQRCALERWMRMNPVPPAEAKIAVAVSCRHSAAKKTCHKRIGERMSMDSMISSQEPSSVTSTSEQLALKSRLGEVGSCHVLCHGNASPRAAPRRGQSPRGTRYYHAEVSVGSLRLSSRRTTSSDDAARMNEVLIEVRDKALDTSHLQGSSTAAHAAAVLMAELPSAMMRRGLTFNAMGVRLTMRAHPFRWVEQPLASSRVAVQTLEELRSALHVWCKADEAWRQLSHLAQLHRSAPVDEEEQEAWQRFQEAYLRLEVAAGRDRLRSLDKLRLAVKEREAYRHSLKEAWLSQCMTLQVVSGRDVAISSSLGALKATHAILKLLSRFELVAQHCHSQAPTLTLKGCD